MLMAIDNSTLNVCKIKRQRTILVAPAEPTPTEPLPLSDIDDQELLRTHVPFVFFFPHHPSMANQDPALLIRQALSKALVHYYPFAGRLRQGPEQRVLVDCTGEGVLFTSADADLSLDQFGVPPSPPFPYMDDLLYNVPGSEEVLNSPLLVVQVTRLAGSGFVFALRMNHAMSDTKGIAQFINAVAEIARGSPPSVPPAWGREILTARCPNRTTRIHNGFNDVARGNDGVSSGSSEEMVFHTFFFGKDEVSAARQHLRCNCSTFDIIASLFWKCWAAAWSFDPDEEVRLSFVVDVRPRLRPGLLPDGYYGNLIVMPAAFTTVGELCRNPLDFAVELTKKAKAEVDEEYVRSMADLLVADGRQKPATSMAYVVSDLTRGGLGEADFGWGKAVYAGPAMGGGVRILPCTYHVAWRNEKGEDGILVPMRLPKSVMEKFKGEISNMVTSCAN